MKRGTFYFKTYGIPKKAQLRGSYGPKRLLIKEERLKIKELHTHHKELEKKSANKKRKYKMGIDQ